MLHLQPTQVQFLLMCVGAIERIAPQQSPFVAVRLYGSANLIVIHSGLPGGKSEVYPGDLAALTEVGFIRRIDKQFDFTPRGFAFYNEYQRRGGRLDTMNDKRSQFLNELRRLELSTDEGWCDLLSVGAQLGFDSAESVRIANALYRDGQIVFLSEQGNKIRSSIFTPAVQHTTNFDQRYQSVTTQYNYNGSGNINVGSVSDRESFIQQLEQIQNELRIAIEQSAIDQSVAEDADMQLNKAIEQASEPTPNNGSLLARINGAKALIDGVTSTGSAANALVTALAG